MKEKRKRDGKKSGGVRRRTGGVARNFLSKLININQNGSLRRLWRKKNSIGGTSGRTSLISLKQFGNLLFSNFPRTSGPCTRCLRARASLFYSALLFSCPNRDRKSAFGISEQTKSSNLFSNLVKKAINVGLYVIYDASSLKQVILSSFFIFFTIIAH